MPSKPPVFKSLADLRQVQATLAEQQARRAAEAAARAAAEKRRLAEQNLFTQAIGAHWDAHLARMVDFWSTVALGSKRYRGNVAARHLALEGITPAHFAAWVRLWAEHTDARFPPAVAQQLQQTAHGVARNLFRVCLGQPPAFVQAHGHSH